MREGASPPRPAALIEDGEPVPPPSTLDAIMAARENEGGVAVLALAPEQAARSVRVNVTIPEDALARIDRFSEGQGFTRSGFLVRAALAAIDRERA